MSYPLEHFRFLKNARRFLSKHLREEAYDVTHCHFILSTGLLAQWVKRKFGIPYLITSHGSDLPGFNPDRFQFIHSITPFFIKRILRNCNYVVSPSNFLASLILPHLKDNDKLKVVANGIKDHATIFTKEDIILSTGRLLERKGFQTLIKALYDIDLGYELHICGDGPMMMRLKEMSIRSKTKIIFHGWLDNTSKKYQKLLARAKIYVLVSQFENASISLLEAMINSCAVVTSKTSGCPETVGETGICIPPNNPMLLREQLLKLVDDSEIVKEMGRSARERALSTFSWKSISEDYEELLKSMISR